MIDQTIRDFLFLTTPQQGIIVSVIIFICFKVFKIIFKKRKYKKNYLATHGRDLNKMKKMDWKDFEFLCEQFFQSRGWKTSCSDKSGADGGVDVWLHRGKEKAIVQCKRYETTKVGVKVVREMYGLMISHECNSAYILTTSGFTKEGYKFAKGKRISLLDGKQLEEIIEKNKLFQ